ncbi:MAG TPA: HEAT repeat domain-containing protein [Leptospiraceae bacterium]|nr:HEAT repeat domain-containing protein [Leptospiraceae bacterium]HMW07775.1 HEAT repeat domain-containing protein [Leptospiraceae bacterium]HMX34946.1 HEAT repeat domain-containing protein [Leptospiraceae bacterium]HMY34282.1 HEAT repeat domain-containing protein [Leptospiraceae bacterium]HMZ64082.1 HEAT repeat domain-containing protein [Leptospiraceae bacterium]
MDELNLDSMKEQTTVKKTSFWAPKQSWIFILLTLSLSFGIFATSEKDELKENLLGSEKKQKQALLTIKNANREDLFPIVSDVLRKTSSEGEIQGLILDLYFSYGPEIEKYNPKIIEDLEWVFENTKNETNLIKVLHYAATYKEKRLMYHILDFIRYRDATVREFTFKAIDSFKDDRALPFILELGSSDQPILRYYYLESLNYINDERASMHVAKLLTDPSPAIRSESIVVIEKLGLKEKLNSVLAMATNDSNYEVRKTAVVSLKNQRSKFPTTVYQKTIFDSNREVRDVTVDAITTIKDPSYAKFISAAMEKENLSPLRLKMVDSLLVLNNHGGGFGLSAALKNDKDSEVRAKAALAIGKLKATPVVRDLVSSLDQEKVVNVKIEITRSLGSLKEKSAVPVILKKLQTNEANELRSEFLTALNQIDDPKVMPVIFDLIDLENTEIIKTGMKSLLRTMLYRYHGGGKEYRTLILSDKISMN